LERSERIIQGWSFEVIRFWSL